LFSRPKKKGNGLVRGAEKKVKEVSSNHAWKGGKALKERAQVLRAMAKRRIGLFSREKGPGKEKIIQVGGNFVSGTNQ